MGRALPLPEAVLRLSVVVGLLLVAGSASGMGGIPECPPDLHITPSGSCEGMPEDPIPDVPEAPSVPTLPPIGVPRLPSGPALPSPSVPVVPVYPQAPAVPAPPLPPGVAPPEPSALPREADVSAPVLPAIALPFFPPAEGLRPLRVALPTLFGARAGPSADLVGGGYGAERPSFAGRPPEAPTGSARPPAAGGGWTATVGPAIGPASYGGASATSGREIPSAAAGAAFGVALAWAALALHRRLAAARVLDNAVRRRLFDHVLLNPGMTCTEAARAVGVHYVTADRHLRVLVRFGHVVAFREVDGPRYFENHGKFGVDAKRAVAWLRRPANATFLETVARSPDAGVLRLAEALGIARSTASRRAALLCEEGFLAPRGRGFVVTERARVLQTGLDPSTFTRAATRP